MRSRLGLGIILCCTLPPFATAQQPPDNGPASATTPAVPTSATQDEFERVFDRWTNTLKQLQTIRIKFQSVADTEKPALQEQFRQLMVAARELAPQLIEVAEKAYVAAPNQDKRIADFLLRVAVDNLQGDNYEEGLRVLKILIDGKTPDRRSDLLAGVAAFHTNQYDLAESHFKAASQAGLFEAAANDANRVNPALRNQATQQLADLDKFRRLWASEQKIRAAEAEADDLPRVQLQTGKGTIVLELFENETPNTVANFIHLVEKGYYDGLAFHRVLPGFMAQGGCPRGDGSGGPGYRIPCECHQDQFRRHFRGSLSMAHRGRDTGGSQFFLTFVRTSHLDGKHTVFGRVVEGMDVLSRLARIDPSQPRPGLQPDKIIKASVLRKRPHEYTPTTQPAPS